MLNIIVAPASLDKNAEKFTKRIVRYLKNEKVEYSTYFSFDFESVSKNIQELLSFGESEFIVVGDDLILHEFINCVKDLSKVKLGIVPTNNKNDFATFLELSLNPIQAIKDILKKKIENVDLLLVNDMRVINNVIIGASVEVLEKYEQFKLKNFVSEKIATLKYGTKFEGIELSLDIKNSKIKTENIYELVVANGGLSKGKPVSPLSNVQDGLFNLNYSTVESLENKKRYLNIFSKGTHIYSNQTKQLWLNNLKINNENKSIKALIDGKIYTLEKLEILLIENALKLYKA